MPKSDTRINEKTATDQTLEFQILKMLSDPMRTRIILELLVHEEMSTIELQKRIPIGRSTLGHHLQKLEENNIVKVRIQEKGYSVKFYSLTKALISKFSLKQALNTPDKNDQAQSILDAFSSLTGVLQFIANIAYESYNTLQQSKITNIHKKGSDIWYQIDKLENQFLPISFNIIPNSMVSDFQNLVREFIEKSQQVQSDDKPITNANLPLYAFITTGFPILFFSSTNLSE